MTPDRHGEPSIITIRSDIKALPITLWLIERLGTRTGKPRHSHCLTSKGEQSKADLPQAMLYPQTVAIFLCQSSYEGSCSIQPALFVRVRFILPSPVLLGPVSIYLKWSYEERTFLQMMPVVEQGLDGGETGKMLLLSLCSPGAPWSDGDVP